ncbi:nuclease-related domain-containing protein [Nocardioides sp.]|uniref:nuclease-related domain-containing protein n=1 Tax=Nocardioides sp. TaxID=35761 RepID=UPI0035B0ED9D
MTAGESAYDVARRQREKAERLQKSAALWEQGAEGEVAVARALEALPEGWVALHDLAWPGRQRANLDHVVVGPGGVFIVDAKNWTGRIEVRDQVLLQNGRPREQAVTSVVEADIALQKVLPGAIPCRSVLCFVGEQPLTDTSWNVLICSTQNLTDVLTSQPAVLGPDDVRACVDAVRAGTARRSETPVPQAVSRRSKKRRRALVELLVGLAAVAVFLGGYKTVANWMGEQLSDVVVTNTPDKPTPTKDGKQNKQRKERQDKQR